MSNGFCVNYCLVLSIAAMILLSYFGVLCWIDAEELRIEGKSDKAGTLFIAAAIYLFFFVVMIGIKCRKSKPIAPQGYEALDSSS